MYDEFTKFAEAEYYQAKKEVERLEDLWEDARWYHSEVAEFKKWSPPWYTSFPGSLVEMFSQNHIKESTYEYYYRGAVEMAPLLPPMIVYAELQPARELRDLKFVQLKAASDWAPGGPKYNEHLQSEGAIAYALLSNKTKNDSDSRS
jgi:hypothetical protein